MSRKLFVSTVAGAAALVGLASVVQANSSTTISLSASVADACSFGTVTDISFGSQYQPGQTTSLTGGGNLVINCTVGSQSVTLTPDGGLAPGGSLGRQLEHETDNTEFLDYFMEISDTDGANANLLFPVATGYVPVTDLDSGDNTFKVDATISGSQSAIGGTYSDTVGITMSF